jgi:malonyl CoA-acyl carrier protein transacylase
VEPAAPVETIVQPAGAVARSAIVGEERLVSRWSDTALAFTGYSPCHNLGRSRELLQHRRYGRIVREMLHEGSQVCSQAIGRRVDLTARVARGEEPLLENYAEAVTLVVVMELAQLTLLEEFHGASLRDARLALGFSLGEVAALIAAGRFELAEVMPPLLALTDDCIALAHDVHIAFAISRMPGLYDVARRLCAQINAEGRGMIGVSAHLSPNAGLVMGQGDTLDRFEVLARREFGQPLRLHRMRDRWPPLHTPLMHQRDVRSRAVESLRAISDVRRAPELPILSLVTGTFGYTDGNALGQLGDWIDQPQQVWDAIYKTLELGVGIVVHVGPAPKIFPSTYERIGDHVVRQLGECSLQGLRMRAVSGLMRHRGIARLLRSRTVLLGAPHVRHVILENWLLAHDVG